MLVDLFWPLPRLLRLFCKEGREAWGLGFGIFDGGYGRCGRYSNSMRLFPWIYCLELCKSLIYEAPTARVGCGVPDRLYEDLFPVLVLILFDPEGEEPLGELMA